MLQQNNEFSPDKDETKASSSSEDKGAVIYAEVVEGDYNDVYSRTQVKGTWEQIEEYVKSYFSERGLREAEDMNTDGFGLYCLYPVSDENGNEIDPQDPRYDELSEQQEPLVQYSVEAYPFDPEEEKEYIRELEAIDAFIDLGEQD